MMIIAEQDMMMKLTVEDQQVQERLKKPKIILNVLNYCVMIAIQSPDFQKGVL